MDDFAEPGPKARWSLMDRLFQLGCGIIVSSALLAVSSDRFRKLMHPSLSLRYLLDSLGIVLLVIVVILVFRWIFAVFGEMRMLREYFPNQIRPQPGQAYVWAVLFSIILGTLGSLTDDIIKFCALFALYSVGDIWGQSIRDGQLKVGFESARNDEPRDPRHHKRRAIEDYYFGNPHVERSATIMFFSFVALSIALIGNNSQSGTAKEQLHAAAYIATIANIVVSEIVIWRWRNRRDTALEEKYSF